MNRLLLLVCCCALVATDLVAQGATDIHLVPIIRGQDGVVTELGTPRAVTDREGYDNQPAFLPDGKTLVYTSIVEIEGTSQADIWRFDIASGERARVTHTDKESEYSPTPIPGDADGLSVIRVEVDNVQRLWRVSLSGDESSVLLPDIAPVGYHAWGPDDRLGLFVLGEPPTLQAAVRGPGEGKVLASDIGRALARIPDSDEISFVRKATPAADGREVAGWRILRANLETGDLTDIVATRPEREDYAWDSQGALWMADGTTLYQYRPAKDVDWGPVDDLADHGVKGTISRLAISPDGLLMAVVAERAAN
ncbi:MAG: hypothetical protein AAGD38_02230 [Acidobacteriota bacterium]